MDKIHLWLSLKHTIKLVMTFGILIFPGAHGDKELTMVLEDYYGLKVRAVWNYLIRQLESIRPRVIVTLGNPATQNLLQTQVGITKLRGNWQQLPDIGKGLAGILVMPTFHPSYILRRYTPEIRGKAWSDLQAVTQELGLTIPKKI